MEQKRGDGRKPFYEDWMEREGIPIYKSAAGVEDITELPRRPWARTGGYGTFIQLEGTRQAGALLYVAEIPAGGALEPERHLYDELIYILRGRGLSEVWQEGGSKRTFEWGEGSLFAMPRNVWHRLVNGGRKPTLFFARTNAPVVMNTFRNMDFIFNCDYKFTDCYTGQTDYFKVGEKRYEEGLQTYWETNFVPDVRAAFLDNRFEKVEGGQLTQFKMAAWGGAHASEWPVGIYHKAHCHGPGAVLLGLKSVGYVLVWPGQYGIHPYQDGYGDKVVRMDWGPGSIYSPYGTGGCTDSFHQHFNTGPEPARHLALRSASDSISSRYLDERGYLGFISVRDGGRVIEYEDEDPEIRQMFEKELRQNRIECTMPPVIYRKDPFKFSL